MVQTAWRSVEDTDRQVLVVDARRGIDRDTEMILAELTKSGRRLTLAINKLDLVKPPAVLPLIDRLNQTGLFDRVFIVSALTGDGCEDLLNALGEDLPEARGCSPRTSSPICRSAPWPPRSPARSCSSSCTRSCPTA